MTPRILQQLRVLRDLASPQRLERRADAAREPHAPDHEPLADTEVLPDRHSRNLQRGRHRQGGGGHDVATLPASTVHDPMSARSRFLALLVGAVLLLAAALVA